MKSINKNKMKQTAVEWLEDNIQSNMTFMEILGLIRQAKEMEKEQIVDAYRGGKINQLENSEIYYNQTFKSE